MWSQKYLVIDKPFFRKSSRMYLCTLHSRKWWMDDANTEQMVGGIRLRIKISQWMCALILHNFVQFFTLQFGQRYVSSHLLYTWMWTLVSKSKQPCFALHEIISFPEKPWSFRSIILDFKKKKVIIVIIFSSTHHAWLFDQWNSEARRFFYVCGCAITTYCKRPIFLFGFLDDSCKS